MKNTKFTKVMFALASLLSLPALSSCGAEGYGRELTNQDSEEAQTLLDSISLEMKNVKNFEMKVKENLSHGSLYGMTLNNVKTEQTFLVNEKRDMYTTYLAVWDGGKKEIISYMYDSGDDWMIKCYGQSTLTIGDSASSNAGHYGEENASEFYDVFTTVFKYYDTFYDPYEFLSGRYGLNFFFGASYSTASFKRSLYSKGNGNLTIKVEKNIGIKDYDSNEKEDIVSEVIVLSYDNYVFKSASVEQITDYGNKNSWGVSFTKKDYFTIDFPEAMKRSQA